MTQVLITYLCIDEPSEHGVSGLDQWLLVCSQFLEYTVGIGITMQSFRSLAKLRSLP